MTITFRLELSGPVPDDAVFALQSGMAGGAQHAIYLCSYYGGYPACTSSESYDDVLTVPAGTQLMYQFWRELDVNGTNEEMDGGELTAEADQVVLVTYEFPP